MKQTDKVKALLDIFDEQQSEYMYYKKNAEKMYEAGDKETAYYYDLHYSLKIDNLIEIRNKIIAIVEQLENR